MACHIERRKFLATLGGAAAAWPLAVAHAQQPSGMRQIGVLMSYPQTDPEAQTFLAAFQEELQKLGWTEARNIRVSTRWTSPDNAEAMQRFAREIVALQPDLIQGHTTTATTALLQQTRSIPIVFAFVSDPVGSGSREFSTARWQRHRFHRHGADDGW
jgi:ABC-type uncharacterized transport system substrate-binding protein